MKNAENYCGFELGPIRPPSEAKSLLLRIIRNCPWNKCKFCGLYRGKKFSVRPLDHIMKDIATIRHYVDDIQKNMERLGGRDHKSLMAYHSVLSENQQIAFQSALRWFQGGMKSVFLQDADALIIKPDDLVEILLQIRKSFPQVRRITSYARSQTIARISDENMTRLAQAGLNRIHIGMESASDEVLSFIKKGVDKKTHIVAGQKVKRAGIELSEYFMPGLGGEQYSRANALETADALNQINPDFIRIRTLAIPESVELFQDFQSGAFARIGDVQMVEELLLFLKTLRGISSTVESDHILNLFQEVEGRLPEDKERMTAPIREFLAMAPEDQLAYMVGRRTGVFFRLSDMTNPELLKLAYEMREAYRVTLDNVDVFAAGMMQRFI
ncbi:MAG: coproporphyrinogen III oxidase [Desulfuromonadales bacterium C00003094]|nr:MAG: coproporphyrinogen III oxidase [Desulfuromonadales bacterium C00003094]